MSLEYAILGFLSYRPYSGYDLKKVFDTSVRHFWYADQSQIYRTLAQLNERGWTEIEVVEQTERPDRKVYHITPPGKQALLDWLAGPFPNPPARSGPLVQVFFMGQLSDEAILAKFEAAAEIFRQTLARYAQVPTLAGDAIREVDSPREVYFWLQTLEEGRRTTQANLEWVEGILETIRSGKLPPQKESKG